MGLRKNETKRAGTKAGPRLWNNLILVIFIALFSIIAVFRYLSDDYPNTAITACYFISWRYGFIGRGLVGTILEAFPYMSMDFIHKVCYFSEFLLTLIVLLWAFTVFSKCDAKCRIPAFAAILIFLAAPFSPYFTYLLYNCGRLDVFLITIVFVQSILYILKSRGYSLFIILLTALGGLIHTGHTFMYFSFSEALLLCDAVFGQEVREYGYNPAEGAGLSGTAKAADEICHSETANSAAGLSEAAKAGDEICHSETANSAAGIGHSETGDPTVEAGLSGAAGAADTGSAAGRSSSGNLIRLLLPSVMNLLVCCALFSCFHFTSFVDRSYTADSMLADMQSRTDADLSIIRENIDSWYFMSADEYVEFQRAFTDGRGTFLTRPEVFGPLIITLLLLLPVISTVFILWKNAFAAAEGLAERVVCLICSLSWLTLIPEFLLETDMGRYVAAGFMTQIMLILTLWISGCGIIKSSLEKLKGVFLEKRALYVFFALETVSLGYLRDVSTLEISERIWSLVQKIPVR